jgi:hypothetical protein
VTVVATDKSKVYGDVNPTLTATATGAVGTDVINYTLATTAVTGLMSEPILWCMNSGTNPNYTVTKTDAVLTVTPKAVTVVATDKSKVWRCKPYSYCNGNRCAVVINYTLATTAVTALMSEPILLR